MAKSTRAAIEVVASSSTQKGYVSGFREILSKARLAAKGDISALGEIEAAKYIRQNGFNVHFQTPTGLRSQAGNTANFLVGGTARTGEGGAPFDVYTPNSNNLNNVITNLAKKNSQAKGVILNLRHTNLNPSDFENLMQRLAGKGKNNIQRVIIFK